MDTITRRHFMQRAAAYSLGFAGLSTGLANRAIARAMSDAGPGFGPLVADPAGVMDLPAGFEYSVVMRQGDPMSDGLLSPGKPDGMAAFPAGEGRCVLVRNHEIHPGHDCPKPFDGPAAARLDRLGPKVFDLGHGRPIPGGTSNVVFNTRTQTVERSFLSLAGTERNCAGGPTPWGTWLTCEETVATRDAGHEQDHGWVFEVPAYDEPAMADPKPIFAMGRFNHEAVALSPAGNIYQTEDRHDGLLYRYIPETPGQLHNGGRLQALVVRGRPSLDTRNWREQTVRVGERLACEWIDVDDPMSPNDDMRYTGFEAGAARFARGEGMWAGEDGIYFCCTNGGVVKAGQVFRLRFPDPTAAAADEPVELELFVQPDDAGVLENADNITVAPSGHLIVCEDGRGAQHLVGVSPRGECYKLGRNALSNSELAGAAFSPDGSTLFVNIQHDGLTLAITGPWKA